MSTEKQQDILTFWFGEDPANVPKEQVAKWWKSDPAFDNEIRTKFGDDVTKAETGAYDDWLDTPKGALARILLWDQFPRNLHRGSGMSYYYDAAAVMLARNAIKRGFDQQLTPHEASFFYMPFMHAENLALQDECIDHYKALAARCHAAGNEAAAAGAEYSVKFAQVHRDLVERFGRFPHRNVELARTSTPEEEKHLAEHGRGY